MKRFAILVLVFFETIVTPTIAGIKAESIKNVIFLIGDGMGLNQIKIAEYILDKKVFFTSLPHTGIVFTSSANHVITDSGAAATALATGFKTNNQMIGKVPNGKDVITLLEAFQKKGKRTGLVTTTEITDATPAAFASHAFHRKNRSEIAQGLLKNKVDLLLGGGKQDLFSFISEFKKNNYTLLHTTQDLLSINPKKHKKALGLFEMTDMNYEIDREEIPSQKDEPSLSLMTQKALEFLSASSKGFFLMVEGGRIDHACHEFDVATMAYEVFEFDNAIRASYDFAKKRKDTLVIITADHETAGISFSEGVDLPYLKTLKVSAEFMVTQIQKNAWGKFEEFSIKEVLKKYADITSVTEEDIKTIQSMSDMPKDKVGVKVGYWIAQKAGLASIVFPHVSLGNTKGHTSTPVPLFALGPGANLFVGAYENTEIPQKIAKLTHVQLSSRP